MAFRPNMPGGRLSFVAVELEGTLKRETCKYIKGKGLVRKEESVPAGYLVYFPRGHVLRLNEEQMKHYGLHRKPRIINMAGLHDPDSPIGKMMAAQNDAERAGAYKNLEQAVMQLAIAKSGPIIMPEMVKKMRFVEHSDYSDDEEVPRGKKVA
jgi:hypothetical protein